jgi:uncharacterized protein
MLTLEAGEPIARTLTDAIRTGNLAELKNLLTGSPELARATIVRRDGCGEQARSLLHIATDYPGHFPNAEETVRVLIAAGADVNARFTGAHGETPLHWAASSDDVGVLDALVEAGADLEADGSVIDGGTPLADAVAFGQWNAARRLLERGATPNLWQAAALGEIRRVEELVAAPVGPTAEEVTNAFSGAHATAASARPRNTFSTKAPTSTGSATTTSPRSRPQPAATHTTSSRGSKPAAPDRRPAPDEAASAGQLLLAMLYVAAALIGHARERSGAISCGCHPDCWCKRPGIGLFRWVFPFWHKPR